VRSESQVTTVKPLLCYAVVSHMSVCRSPEVLRLIANILGFDVDDRVAVGLEVPQGSLLSSLFSTITSPLKAVPALPVQPAAVEVRPPSTAHPTSVQYITCNLNDCVCIREITWQKCG
jgi:hypothetical protein